MKTQAKVMTYAEIEAAFDGEWVLIDEPELTPMNEVVRGAVLFHCESRDEVYREARQRRLNLVAILYIGARPINRVMTLGQLHPRHNMLSLQIGL